MKKHTYCFILCILFIVAVFCSYKIYDRYATISGQEKVFQGIASAVEQEQEDSSSFEHKENSSRSSQVSKSTSNHILSEYQKMARQNPDMIGWIRIADTTLNYPVMQTIKSPNFYLKHNFYKKYSDLGVPYVQENCNIETSDNLIIYGHHIKGGMMFGMLEDYKSRSFFQSHKMIQFDTLTKQSLYEIIAVFKTTVYSANGFKYYDFVDAAGITEFNSYVDKCKELSFYDTGGSAKYGDKLISLSTCEYSAPNGRLVVVAKKVQ